MRVKLCDRCPYVPADVAMHYDAEAVLHLCAGCDDERVLLVNHYPREVQCRWTRRSVVGKSRNTSVVVA